MNTISNSGRWNVSDVFSAALYTVDAALEVAAAGGLGINLHWGAGQNLYSPIMKSKDMETGHVMPFTTRPPLYGYLLLQKALATGSRFLAKGSSTTPSYIKIWPLQDVKTGHLRFVIIHKNVNGAVNVDLQLTGTGNVQYGNATISRLVAAGSNPLHAKKGISLAGLTYSASNLGGIGKVVTEKVQASRSKVYRVYMPIASAALVVIPKLSQVRLGS